MAEVVADRVRLSTDFNDLVMERSEVCCENCKKLNLKLQKAVSELSSALAIIKLLQDDEKERNLTKCSGIPMQLEEREGTWIVANSSKRKRLCRGRVETLNGGNYGDLGGRHFGSNPIFSPHTPPL
jgi:hypothetical protein